jgi:site-specific DNA-adenine methylase
MTRVKPLFWYAGGKVKLVKLYSPFFQGLRPEHCIDYFGGSGGMTAWFHHLYPHAKFYLNEKDPALYGLFRCIKEEYEEFLEALRRYKDEYDLLERFGMPVEMQDVYYWLRDEMYNRCLRSPYPDEEERFFGQAEYEYRERYDFLKGTPEEHALFYLLRRFSFMGKNARNNFGDYMVTSGRMSQSLYDLKRLDAFKTLLDQTELLNKDYSEVNLPLPKSLHYFDPPYVNSDENFYPLSFGWEETEALCEYVQRLAEHHTVFISNYDDPQLKKLLKGFQWSSFPPAGGMQQRRKKDPVREILFYKIHPSIAGSGSSSISSYISIPDRPI